MGGVGLSLPVRMKEYDTTQRILRYSDPMRRIKCRNGNYDIVQAPEYVVRAMTLKASQAVRIYLTVQDMTWEVEQGV
jgi:hypothetical protein